MFPSLDNFKYRGRWWVIDIGGSRLRLMVFIEFKHNRLYVRHIVPHAEYDVCYELLNLIDSRQDLGSGQLTQQ